MRFALCSAAVAGLMLTGVASADVLYDNGSLVTHPGAGLGGVDVSMADAVTNTAGSNARHFPPDEHFRIADDFTVGPVGWFVDTITVHAYQTGAATPTWTGANLNIWNGAPNDGGSSIVHTPRRPPA